MSGLAAIEGGIGLPPYFNDLDLRRVKEISKRVKDENGQWFEASHLSRDALVPTSATVTEQSAANVTKLLQPRFQAIGSIIGRLEVISVHGPPRFNVYEAVTKRAVTCRFSSAQQDEVAAALGHRVTVTGIIHRNANGQPVKVDRPELRILEPSLAPPAAHDLLGLIPDIAGDDSAEEYVRQLRHG